MLNRFQPKTLTLLSSHINSGGGGGGGVLSMLAKFTQNLFLEGGGG